MNRRLLSLTSLFVVLLLLVPMASVPVLAQSGDASAITHRQSVRTEMDASGEVTAARIFTQLTVQGDGDVTVALPGQSTRGLRNLDGFGRPQVDGDQVLFNVAATADGASARTVADHRDPAPIELDVAYRLDGQEVEPGDVVGQSGELEVSFTARNTTAEPVEVEYRDGRNQRRTETIDVAVPFVGSLSMELDGRFVGIDAPGASVAGNGRGDTFVSWSMVLFSPVGSEEQTVTYTAQVTDAYVPDVVAQFLPVDADSFTSLAAVQDNFGAVSDGLRDLTIGAMEINANLTALAIGVGQLFTGIGRLSRGGGELAEGLNETAVPGARQLAEGTGAARSGSRDLSVGANTAREGGRELAAGTGQASSGSQELAAGARTARDGGRDLAAGTGQASSGSRDLAAGLGDLSAGAGELSTGLSQAFTGGTALAAGLGQLETGATQLNTGVSGVRAGIGNTSDTAANGTIIGGVNSLRAGAASIPDSVEDALETNLEQALNLVVLPQLETNLRSGLQGNLQGALQTQVKPPLVDGVEEGIRTNLGAALQLQLRPQLVEELQDEVEAGLKSALQPALQAQLTANLAGALQAQLGLDQDQATAFATGFAAQFAPAFVQGIEDTPGFAEQFAAGFAASVDPELEDAFTKVANDFATGFAAGFEPQLGDAFDEFAAVFAPLFAAGFAEQVEPSFTTFAEQFAEQFADGLDATLNAELLPGFDRLLFGLDNPGCDLAKPTDPVNPCGIRQVLALLDAGSADLASGASDAGAGSRDLRDGLGQLDAGGRQLAAGSSAAAAGSRDLRNGLSQLDNGANQLASGLGDLADGAGQLSGGLGQIDDGANQLANGLGDLSDGAGELSGGLGQIDDGANRLANGLGDLSDGAGQLADGLLQIDDGANQLADGLGDAGDGATQVAEGLRTVEDALGGAAEGSQRLIDEGMDVLIASASDATGTPAVAVEHAIAADARGRAGEGLPYGTPEGAVASAVYQFELAGHGGADEGPSVPVRALVTLLGIGVASGLALVLRRRIV